MATSLSPGTGLPSAWKDKVTDFGAVQKYPLGQHRMEGGKVYKYVQYDDATAAVAGVAGEVAYYYTLDGYKNNVVTSDLSDSVEMGAGVLMGAFPTDNYGWIQIKGAATLTIALTAGADGDPLSPTGSADGTLDTVEAVAALGPHVCAVAGDISDKEILCDFPW